MPRQLYCTGCTERTFYVMAQDDGSIEIFCVKNNHKQLIVDIPALVEVIYNGKADGGTVESGGPKKVTRDEIDQEVQAGPEVKPAIVLDGASRLIDS